MDIKKTDNVNDRIISFANSGKICLCDDYPYPMRLYSTVYPSVRHAVLSWKTDDISTKILISRTLLPADLKDLENSIKKVGSIWKLGQIKSFFESYTFKKFNSVNEYAQKLLSTDPLYLFDGRMKDEADLRINELQKIDNFNGVTLMKIRESLKKQKAL